MVRKKIKFKGVNILEEVANFVRISEKIKSEIAICSGENFTQWRVNGKSIMGIYSLDLSSDLIVEVKDAEEAEKFFKRISKVSYILED